MRQLVAAGQTFGHGSQEQRCSARADHEARLSKEDHLFGRVEGLSYLVNGGCEYLARHGAYKSLEEDLEDLEGFGSKWPFSKVGFVPVFVKFDRNGFVLVVGAILE
jgi:hypothetical protein